MCLWICRWPVTELFTGSCCCRGHVRTLVLDLNDVLIHADWKRERGWRSFKRPGVEEFLQTAGQFYELVLYTDQNNTYADPILDRIGESLQLGGLTSTP